MSQRWLSQSERSNQLWLVLGRWGALTLGRPFMRFAAYPIAFYFFLFSKEGRAASRLFLSKAFSRKVTWRDIYKHYYTFGMSILDRVYFFAGKLDGFKLSFHGLPLLKKQLQAKKGCILLGSHLGSFELLRAVAIHTEQKPTPVKVLMHTDRNEKMYHLLNEMNPEFKDMVIEVGRPDTLLKVKEAVDKGCMVGILGDRVMDERSATIDFLSEEAQFPLGPFMLADFLKVPVISFFGLYEGKNCYAIHIEALHENVQAHQEAYPLLYDYVKKLEHYAKHAPYNWFNFYDFWQSAKEAS